MFCPPRFPILPPERTRVLAVWAGIGVVAAMCVTVLLAIALAQATPSWWHPVDRNDPQVQRSASDLENDLVAAASQVRPTVPGSNRTAPWEFTVSAAEANAWLNTRLPKWLRNQTEAFKWPAEISEVQIDFSDDQVRLGIQIKSGDSAQILTAAVAPALRDGALYAPALSVALGRLPVPKGWFLSADPVPVAEERIPKALRELPQTKDLAAAFAGRTPVVQTPIIKFGDGRRVRLLSLIPRDGMLHVTCCTEQR